MKTLLTTILLAALALPVRSAVDPAKAGTRWWWLGSAVTPEGLTWQMEQLASHGIGAVEITPLYGVQGNAKNNIPFLSPEWTAILGHTLREGQRLGIQVDMNLGTGWPFGGPQVPITEAACKLVVVDTMLATPEAASFQAVAPEKERPYARLITQRAYKKADGRSRVIALFESRTRQKVKRAAPGGEGWVVDHFDSTAVAHYLARFDEAFRGMGQLPATFFNDSYEVYRADWTPTLPAEFERRRGYSLFSRLEQFVDGDAAVISDYRETLSDLLLENFTRQWVRWSHAHGALVRNQAHGSPANLIDVYAAVDIPEIEGFGLTAFGIKGLRQDPGMSRRNYSDFSMLKYASSAAHVTGRRLTSSETFTWLTEHFRTSLSQMKPDLDLMFVAGVNRMFFHGTAYSPKDEAWPGWKFYASIDMSPTNTIWRDAPELMRYIRVCQERLQAGRPDNDFLVMLPVRNMWRTNLGERLMQFDIHSMDKKAPEFQAMVLRIDSLGYDCDYTSERLLLSTTVVRDASGRPSLRTRAGTLYRALLLPEGCIMSAEAERHVAALREAGAVVITGTDSEAMAKAARPEALRAALGLKTIRRRVGDGWQYFVANLTPRDVAATVTLAATGCETPLSLRSGESCFLYTVPGKAVETFFPIARLGNRAGEEPLIDLTNRPWRLSFVASTPAMTRPLTLARLSSWETLKPDTLRTLMGTGVYETTFRLARRPGGLVRIDLGDVRESARVTLNGHDAGCAWCLPYTLDVPAAWLRDGDNELRVEVTNLPANRIAALDREGVKWRKFEEINVVDINYKKTTYGHWAPMPSGLNSTVKIYQLTK